MGNPGDSDSFLIYCTGGYDNGVQTQGQFGHLKLRFPPPGVGNRGDSDTKGANECGEFSEEIFKCQNPLGLPIRGTLVIHIDWCIIKTIEKQLDTLSQG